MPLYKYIVKSGDGQTIEGSMDATNEGDVINELRAKGFLIVEVKRAKDFKKAPSRKKVSLD
ncbi:MAG: hypothetical protein ACD_79C01381G0001, partial [uncultured bacterium]